ncbi:sigma-70 family RNA polymerase sigma factor [uncultured Kriegella sp.]|uniref:RNA polymerase sigma factor n=1 Tax=uncultured Kriegella sp. TaxID=1798910 RepID=UPI0030DD061E|tara:strand:+ start:18443 stop:18934 length:492 start_codon:yes stop_codon:yes gene_type:complete
MINFIGFVGYDDRKEGMVTIISKYFFKLFVTERLFEPSKIHMPIDDDQLIINNVLNGDTTAFAVLVNRHKNMVFTLAFRMLKNREEAEELAQDTFVKVFRSLEKFKGEAKFSTWVYRITYNGCLDRLKKLKNEPYVVALDEFDRSGMKSVDNTLDFLEQYDRT